MSLLITNALVDDTSVSIFIDGEKITAVYQSDAVPPDLYPDTVLDAEGKKAVPSFKNGHTHAAMTLLRGFADDMKLQPWLEEKIWPTEAKLTGAHIYWGTRLAALEMIKTGTTFCNDMYFHFPQAWKAYRDSGIKAAVGPAIMDHLNEELTEQILNDLEAKFTEYAGIDKRLIFSPAPHAVYTVSEKTLRRIAGFSREKDLIVHIHLSETGQEVDDCVAACGMRPVEYLDSIGFLGPNIVAAHGVWLSDREIELLAEHQVTVVHNPVSNMKLASGSCFRFGELSARKVPMMLGTDGCSSNNNLDMCEEMKAAALLQKHHFLNTELMTADEIFSIATGGKTSVYPNISSEIKPGGYADLLLINPNHYKMVPDFNTISNMVYSCGEEAIDTVICNGEILMRNRRVDDEETIIEEARRCARDLVSE